MDLLVEADLVVGERRDCGLEGPKWLLEEGRSWAVMEEVSRILGAEEVVESRPQLEEEEEL